MNRWRGMSIWGLGERTESMKREIEQMSVRGEDGREKMMESTTYGIGTRVQQ